MFGRVPVKQYRSVVVKKKTDSEADATIILSFPFEY
jgi:hypothetical protein